MPASPKAPNPMARSLIRVPANRTPANAKVRRHASTAMTVPAATPKSARTHHVAIVRTITATTARRLTGIARATRGIARATRGIARAARVIAARAVRHRASKTRNSVTSGPTHPGMAARRSDPMRRAASGLIPIVRKARENLAATKSSLAAPRIATATGGIGARARILVAGIARATRGIAAIQSLGRSAMLPRPITPGAIPAHHVMARSTSPVMTKRVPRRDRTVSGAAQIRPSPRGSSEIRASAPGSPGRPWRG